MAGGSDLPNVAHDAGDFSGAGRVTALVEMKLDLAPDEPMLIGNTAVGRQFANKARFCPPRRGGRTAQSPIVHAYCAGEIHV